jgi:hypothetical protein
MHLLQEAHPVNDMVQPLKQIFNFYNFERAHQSLDGKAPAELYLGTVAALQAA